MNLKLKSLQLINFKGIKDLDINFSNNTSISGANATGKTTIFDAYSWLLWDKDSLNRKDFGIKPYDLDGSTKSVESTVIGRLEVDDKQVELKKIYKEIWTKKRGQTKATFTGNTTEYFINNVPVKKTEYNSRIESIVSEKEFNLLSNPIYFNQILDKKERREVLLSLIKGVDKEDIIKANSDLKALDLDNYSIDEIKAMAKASASKINKEIESLPSRIDELEKSKNTYDFKSIERNKESLEKKLEEIEKSLSSGSSVADIIFAKSKKAQELMDKKMDLKADADRKSYEARKKAEEAYQERKEQHESKKRARKNSVEDKEAELLRITNKLKDLTSGILQSEEQLNKLRDEYIALYNKSFDGSLDCPTCGRPFEEHDQKEIKENFNKQKSEKLTRLDRKGKETAARLEQEKEKKTQLEEQAETLNKEIEQLKAEIKSIGEFNEEKTTFEEVDVTEELDKIQAEIDQIKSEIDGIAKDDNSELVQEQKRIKSNLESINNTLGLKGQNKALDERIEAYKLKEEELAKDYEQQQEKLYLCEEYLRVFTEIVSSKINNLFDYVSFKLFDTQVNGGLVETCEATISGVPYSDLNNAAKINAGLDVISTLSKHLDIQVPIFVDNAESVNELRKTESQLVKLIVSEDEELKIKGE